MTREAAETRLHKNAGSSAGPKSHEDLDHLARINAGLLPPQPGVLEADRHGYPAPSQRVHKGSTPTGGVGGGHLHESLPVKRDKPNAI
jgi:hypothetical protein